MNINGKLIGKNEEPFIIAELSANHGGSLERAKKSIEAASKTGISAIKLQTYTPDTMTIKSDLPDFKISDGIWSGYTLHDLYAEAYTPFEWHKELFDHAKNLGVIIFSTPFDESAVDLLEELNTPAYKIASFEITDIPLIKYIAKKNKPIFLSTGMASETEIKEAVQTIRKENDVDILLFHCISSYPTITKDSNLNNILWLSKNFDTHVGLSDHTTDNIASITAIGMGAVAIEKHFKLDDNECGPDSTFSLNINQLENLVKDCNLAWTAKGQKKFFRPKSEEKNKIFRRSLYFVKNLTQGEIIKDTDIRRIRPGYGLAPNKYSYVIGKKVKQDVRRGDAVDLKLIEDCFF